MQIPRYLVVVSHTNVPDIHSLPPNCGSSIEWHSRLSFNIQVLGKTTHLHICTGATTNKSVYRHFSYFSASQESQMLFNVTLTQKVRCMHHICHFCGVCDKFDVWSEVSELSILSWVLSFQVITLITCFNVSVLQVSRIVYFNTIQSVMIWGSYQLQIESQKSKHTRICSISIWTNCILVSSAF